MRHCLFLMVRLRTVWPYNGTVRIRSIRHRGVRRFVEQDDGRELPQTLVARIRRIIMNNDSIDVGMTPCHPGEFIREEILAPLELSISRAASILGVRRATLSDLVNEKSALSAEMALRLEKAFGLEMDTLLRMQAWHDATVMRGRAGEVHVERYVPA